MGRSVLSSASAILALLAVAAVPRPAAGVTRTWTGAAGDGLAGTAGNWLPNGVPASTDHIRLAGAYPSNLTWNAAAVDTVASWTQEYGYTADVTIGTVYPAAGAFTNFTISGDCTISNGIWTHADHTSVGQAAAYRMQVTVLGDMTIGSNAVVTADAKGYFDRTGPGYFSYTGGTHGGQGYGLQWFNTNAPYGSAVNPTTLGSAGFYGDGGGCVILDVGGSLTVAGRVSADGESGVSHGTGAGGSVNIAAAVLLGDGVIRANGGDPTHVNSHSGGGGGRVSLYRVLTNAFTGTLQANGGYDNYVYKKFHGYDGTIAFRPYMDLTLSSNHMLTLRLGQDTTNIFGNVTIKAGATLELSGDPLAEGGYGKAPTVIASNITVEAGGAISADGLGYHWRHGAAFVFYDFGNPHGGAGGENTNHPYGSPVNPVNLGTGGTYAEGGGGIILRAIDTLHNEGLITADVYPRSESHGGGAGGSINIGAGTLSGGGTIRARGGDSAQHAGGGGGRISLASVVNYAFTGSLDVSGGASDPADERGYAGTVAFPPHFDLVLSNETLRLGAGDHYAFNSVHVQSNAVLELDCNPRANNGLGCGPCITASNVTIDAGARVTAKGLGYWRRYGPGFDGDFEHGATHAGKGWGSTTNTYGSVTNPVSVGSGGVHSDGGGAVTLVVHDTLTVDGSIDADGKAGGSWSGGSGGSVNIRAGIVTGGGAVSADGAPAPDQKAGGGGGRVVVVADAYSLPSAPSATGGDNTSPAKEAGAGTVYVSVGGVSSLTIDNPAGYALAAGIWTELPAFEGGVEGETAQASLITTNKAVLALNTNVTVGDLYLRNASVTSLYLQGWTLTVDSYYHDDWGSSNQVSYAGGQIVWKAQVPQGTMIILR